MVYAYCNCYNSVTNMNIKYEYVYRYIYMDICNNPDKYYNKSILLQYTFNDGCSYISFIYEDGIFILFHQFGLILVRI